MVVAIVVAGLSIADHSGRLWTPIGDDYQRYNNRVVTIERIIDPVTLEVDLRDPVGGTATTTVRMIGLAAIPATVTEASRYVESEWVGTQIVLRVEELQQRDRKVRVLAYMDRDGSSLNRALLLMGFVRCDPAAAHTRRIAFEQAELSARRADRQTVD